MKLIACILLSASLALSASTASQTISLSGKDIPLKQLFATIKQQTGYLVFGNLSLLEKAQPVTLSVKAAPLEEVLDLCLEDQGLEYLLKGKTIILMAARQSVIKPDDPLWLIPQPVSGRVVDSLGQPVHGASVRLLGGNQGGSTLADGSFLIPAVQPGKHILEISYIGKRTIRQNITVTDNSPVILDNIILYQEQVDEEAEMVVNTGYQTLSRERNAGSFGKAPVELIKNRSFSMSILKRLDGMVPGLTINEAPGAEGVLIRGLTSINATRAPLYVVDGMPVNSLSSVNPQDVEDVTVLKDATAASIWGARASNGVIVVTTRKGKANQKLSLNYDGFVNFMGKPNLKYFDVLNSRQFINEAKDLFAISMGEGLNKYTDVATYTYLNTRGLPPHEQIMYDHAEGRINASQAQYKLDSLSAINNSGQINDLWYRNALLTNHTLSVSGGGNQYSFYGSLAYTDSRNTVVGDQNQQYKINLRQDFNVNDRIRLFLITDQTNTTTKNKRSIQPGRDFLPYQLFKDDAGNHLSMSYLQTVSGEEKQKYEEKTGINLDYSPLDEINSGHTKTISRLSRITGGINLKLLKGLHYEGVYGLIRGNDNSISFDDEKSMGVRKEVANFATPGATPGGAPVYVLSNEDGHFRNSHWLQENWTVRNQLSYSLNLQNYKHQISVLAGQEAQEQFAQYNTTLMRGFNEMLQTFQVLNYQQLTTTGVTSAIMPNSNGRSLLSADYFEQTENITRFSSYYANAGYTFNDKYTLNGNWRIDESNLYGTDKSAQNRPVWSVGGRWEIARELFMERQNIFDHLALRLTYGITGNSPSPASSASTDILRAATNSKYPNGKGLVLAVPGNSRLTWESTRNFNLGLDFAVMSKRLRGSLDMYVKKTENLIGSLPVNMFTGISAVIGNLGDMNNRGVELMLRSQNIQTTSFSWSTLLNLSYNKNKITKINLGYAVTSAANMIGMSFYEDHPAFMIYAYDFAGLDDMGDPLIRLQDHSVTKTRNVATAEDVEFMGTRQPVWNGGLTNSFRYKGLGLDINIIGNFGHVMRNNVNTLYTGGRLTSNVLADFSRRWKVNGDEAITNIPSYVASPNLSGSRREVSYYTQGNINVLSASFIKLRDITLSYELPRTLIQQIKADRMSLRLQVSNIMLWKANKQGIDPEFQPAFSGNGSVYPVNQHTVAVGVQVAF